MLEGSDGSLQNAAETSGSRAMSARCGARVDIISRLVTLGDSRKLGFNFSSLQQQTASQPSCALRVSCSGF